MRILVADEAGADDYLTKPFDANELRACLRTGRRILELQERLLSAAAALQFQLGHDPLTGILILLHSFGTPTDRICS